jgi:hypothetical protein
MAEVLVEYTEVVTAHDGTSYIARACGVEADNGHWQGWLEFSEQKNGRTIRSGRETTQPNRTDTLYWATGLTAVYLEGALERALHPVTKAPARPAPQPHFNEPAPSLPTDPGPAESILNPFSVYRKGEALLRRQLAALSVWHLANIIRAHGLSDRSSATLNAMKASDLIDLIVTAVQARADQAVSR